jgi:hypothetical protein
MHSSYTRVLQSILHVHYVHEEENLIRKERKRKHRPRDLEWRLYKTSHLALI